MTTIRPQSAPAGPASAGGNVTRTVGKAQQALRTAPKPARNRKRSTQHIPQQAARVRVGLVLYVQLVLAGVAAGTASLLYLRYFSGLGFLIPTLAAAAAGSPGGALCRGRRRALWVAPAVAVLRYGPVGLC